MVKRIQISIPKTLVDEKKISEKVEVKPSLIDSEKQFHEEEKEKVNDGKDCNNSNFLFYDKRMFDSRW